jgi:hypothetical protein
LTRQNNAAAVLSTQEVLLDLSANAILKRIKVF